MTHKGKTPKALKHMNRVSISYQELIDDFFTLDEMEYICMVHPVTKQERAVPVGIRKMKESKTYKEYLAEQKIVPAAEIKYKHHDAKLGSIHKNQLTHK